MAIRLTKLQRELVDIIKAEGGRIMAIRNGSSHILIDYELKPGHVFTQSIPRGSRVSPRWAANFRTAIRATRSKLKEEPPQ